VVSPGLPFYRRRKTFGNSFLASTVGLRVGQELLAEAKARVRAMAQVKVKARFGVRARVWLAYIIVF
jgi:hypothetical protein